LGLFRDNYSRTVKEFMALRLVGLLKNLPCVPGVMSLNVNQMT
uniref:HECT domain-containing protein n=1 Tax=Rodentolepis nana TaxID=102285 RepID=A0A0R3TEC0_RODNA